MQCQYVPLSTAQCNQACKIKNSKRCLHSTSNNCHLLSKCTSINRYRYVYLSVYNVPSFLYTARNVRRKQKHGFDLTSSSSKALNAEGWMGMERSTFLPAIKENQTLPDQNKVSFKT
jgi:hypothetical protein